jgi:predicted component of type VI protein secretion system
MNYRLFKILLPFLVLVMFAACSTSAPVRPQAMQGAMEA